jgi:hypothetical protein
MIIQLKKIEMGGACSTHGEIRNGYILVKNRKEKGHFGDIGVDWENKIRMVTGVTRLRAGPSDSCCEHGNESLNFLTI